MALDVVEWGLGNRYASAVQADRPRKAEMLLLQQSGMQWGCCVMSCLLKPAGSVQCVPCCACVISTELHVLLQILIS